MGMSSFQINVTEVYRAFLQTRQMDDDATPTISWAGIA
jgi:hypothetical protein